VSATPAHRGPEPATDFEATVVDFFDAGVLGDVDRSMALLAEDATYRVNAWNEPFRGHDEIDEDLRRQRREWSDFRYQMLNLATAGNVVLAERIDTIRMHGRDVTVHVAAVFEFDADGRIASWRDYFDSHEIEQQLAWSYRFGVS